VNRFSDLRLWLALFCASFASPSSSLSLTASAESFPIVHIAQGSVRGIRTRGVTAFRGVPYGQAPIGALRWRKPMPAPGWSGVRDGFKFGPSCAQNQRLANFAHASLSEDCLSINVFAPSNGRAPRPVMIWIYGGGFFVGGSDAYDATSLAREGVVVVTFNYRVNAFGFLNHPALVKSGESANFGLADQREALRWVRANIAHFGGDPANITIFGESAGGLSVLAHLVSPLSKGLFAKAIVQSGGYGFLETGGQRSMVASEKAAIKFAHDSGCDQHDQKALATCLRAMKVKSILSREEAVGSTLVIGGPDLPEPIGQALSAGHFAQVPVMIGGNRDEYRWFEALREVKAGQRTTPDGYRALLKTRFGDAAQAVTAKYPITGGEQPAWTFAAAVGDQFFICPGQEAATAIARWTSVWNYEFDDQRAPSYLPPVSFELGAAHTAELAYLFPGFGRNGMSPLPADPARETLADQMRKRWAAFARSADPNLEDTPLWPKFDERTQLTLKIDRGRATLSNSIYEQHHCSFWRALGRQAAG
jgi:para-nitrobenzyl esterase